MLLEKVPDLPLDAIWKPAVVGFFEVPQHTPLEVTAAPPSDVTLPPDVVVVCVMLDAAAVETVGIVGVKTG